MRGRREAAPGPATIVCRSRSTCWTNISWTARSSSVFSSSLTSSFVASTTIPMDLRRCPRFICVLLSDFRRDRGGGAFRATGAATGAASSSDGGASESSSAARSFSASASASTSAYDVGNPRPILASIDARRAGVQACVLLVGDAAAGAAPWARRACARASTRHRSSVTSETAAADRNWAKRARVMGSAPFGGLRTRDPPLGRTSAVPADFCGVGMLTPAS